YTSIVLANDSYPGGGNFTTFPSSAACCNLVNGNHSATMTFQGTTVGAGFVFSSMPAGEGLFVGTIGNTPTCIGTFQHCIMILEGQTGSVTINQGSAGTDLTALTVNNQQTGVGVNWTGQFNSSSVAGAAYGVQIQAGTG